MWKYAGELRIGDLWTERAADRAIHSYRVTDIERGPGLSPMTVTGTCVTTGKEHTMDFFPLNRVKVRKEPT
jgi:hypothetical protein